MLDIGDESDGQGRMRRVSLSTSRGSYESSNNAALEQRHLIFVSPRNLMTVTTPRFV